jgi:hypothetical protein
VSKTYQNSKIDTPDGLELTVPEHVNVVMAEVADDMREGLLALAVGAGLPWAQRRSSRSRTPFPRSSGDASGAVSSTGALGRRLGRGRRRRSAQRLLHRRTPAAGRAIDRAVGGSCVTELVRQHPDPEPERVRDSGTSSRGAARRGARQRPGSAVGPGLPPGRPHARHRAPRQRPARAGRRHGAGQARGTGRGQRPGRGRPARHRPGPAVRAGTAVRLPHGHRRAGPAGPAVARRRRRRHEP